MATTIAFGRLSGVGGPGAMLAFGTVCDVHDAGTFFITDPASGSTVMRNVQTVLMTPLGTIPVIVTASGSSSGAITTKCTRMGSTGESTVLTASGTVDCNFMVIGGNTPGGSLPA